jgi:hypothetical protein
MEYSQDNNAMFSRTKINAVRKTMGGDTPNVLANNGKLGGFQMPTIRSGQSLQ